ncbi:hypothetical protein F0562_013892 [Nyssa sinensis]|uniref:NAC domain-containing protein n=1 Tax=Nyssa sinensis TaxID=561372 RepID=A0A5J4ZLE4_9ASTE|nr:hypothetical protein F0562_013892 [Nyssa sinensis]
MPIAIQAYIVIGNRLFGAIVPAHHPPFTVCIDLVGDLKSTEVEIVGGTGLTSAAYGASVNSLVLSFVCAESGNAPSICFFQLQRGILQGSRSPRNLLLCGRLGRFGRGETPLLNGLWSVLCWPCRVSSNRPRTYSRLSFIQGDGKSIGGDKEPWEIFDTSSTAAERIQYFFSVLKKKSAVGSRFCRTVGKGKGTWKGQDGRKQILDHQGRHIGCKRSFTYVDLNKNRAAAAVHSHDHHRWIMKKYSLDGINLNLSKAKDYVLCRIKYKNQGQKRPLFITTTHQSSSSSTLVQEGIPLPLAITATTTSHPPSLQYHYFNSRQDDVQLLEASSNGGIGDQHIAQQPRNLNEQLCFGDGDGDQHFPQEPNSHAWHGMNYLICLVTIHWMMYLMLAVKRTIPTSHGTMYAWHGKKNGEHFVPNSSPTMNNILHYLTLN